jgi:Caspase domain
MTSIPVPHPDASPGTHALIIGVSDYPFADGPDASALGQSFELESLTTAARSASEVAAWLLNEYCNTDVPLASLRVLLSPAAGESIHPDIAAHLNGPAPATRAAVEAELRQFRADCRRNPLNAAFVYIAGHGIQLNKRGAVVLLHDFGDPEHVTELQGAIDVVGCHDGMEENGIAQTQIWFCDACRQEPAIARRFERLEGALTLSEGLGQVQASPLFLASSSRQNAFAEIDGISIFSQALLWALRGGGATGPDNHCGIWHVGTTQLIQVLPKKVKSIVADHDEEQSVDVTGRVLEMVAQRFTDPPPVDILVNLRPEDTQPPPTAQLLFNAREPALAAGMEWPFLFQGPAGLYLLRVLAQPPLAQDVMKILNVAPPAYIDVVEVT